MPECSFRSHAWNGTNIKNPPYQCVTIQCSESGVGHTLNITRSSPTTYHVALEIFPAKDSRTISRAVIRWSINTTEGTIEEMEQDGNTVFRRDTVITGEPVGS